MEDEVEVEEVEEGLGKLVALTRLGLPHHHHKQSPPQLVHQPGGTRIENMQKCVKRNKAA